MHCQHQQAALALPPGRAEVEIPGSTVEAGAVRQMAAASTDRYQPLVQASAGASPYTAHKVPLLEGEGEGRRVGSLGSQLMAGKCCWLNC